MIRLQPALLRWQSLLLPRAVAHASKSSVADVKATDIDSPVGSSMSSSDSTSATPKKAEQTEKPKSKLIAQVFANLNDTSSSSEVVAKGKPAIPLTKLEVMIKEAKDVETLLRIAATPNLSRKLALSILSTFGDWTADKKITLGDFESDLRFLKMCRILSQDLRGANGLGDLATVLGVTGDDEAAKLISSASMGQMVRIIEKLSAKKKRSPPLLRSLAFNISKSEEKLDVKQCADVLFAMANLSFHDEVLLVKTCSDAYNNLANETKSSVVGSVARSLGILRCRDTALLDRMAEWLASNTSQARPQDVVALLMALATVNHHPSNADVLWKKVLPLVTPLDFPTSGLFLDAVWSLLLLDKISNTQVALVLSPDFIDKLRKEDGSQLSISTSLKLVNLNAAAQSLLTGYKGPMLVRGSLPEVPLTRSKDKAALVACVMDSLLNLLPGDAFLKRDADSGAGFLIDGECLIGSNCTPLPVASAGDKSAKRVAIMVQGYHDSCVGARFHANGVQALGRRLLEARGYKVLPVLHSEFSPSSKLVQRVQYLEHKLKTLVSN